MITRIAALILLLHDAVFHWMIRRSGYRCCSYHRL